MDEALSIWMLPSRGGAIFATGLGLVAMLLAAVGLYAVMSFTVARRTHEIGVRMSLGAESVDVVRMILRQALRLVASGILIGAIAAAAVSRVLGALLFGLSPLDAASYAGVALFLTAVAGLAAWLPARRAARIDPMAALRYE